MDFVAATAGEQCQNGLIRQAVVMPERIGLVTLCFPECGNGIDRRITDIIDRIVERLEEVDLER